MLHISKIKEALEYSGVLYWNLSENEDKDRHALYKNDPEDKDIFVCYIHKDGYITNGKLVYSQFLNDTIYGLNKTPIEKGKTYVRVNTVAKIDHIELHLTIGTALAGGHCSRTDRVYEKSLIESYEKAIEESLERLKPL